MQFTAVYSCVRILAEAVAGLPLHVYRQRGDGRERESALESIIKIARAYGYNPVQAAIDLGYITAEEAKGQVVIQNWRTVPDALLLDELLRRCDDEGVLPDSNFNKPLNSETVMRIIREADEQGVTYDPEKGAAQTPLYPRETDEDQ